jgi:hypothetical protein
MAAITLGAVFTFDCTVPIVELEVGGYSSSATLLGAIRVLWMEQMRWRRRVPVHHPAAGGGAGRLAVCDLRCAAGRRKASITARRGRARWRQA